MLSSPREASGSSAAAANVPATSAPTGIAAGSDGAMWFTDQGQTSAGHSLIGRIAPDGTFELTRLLLDAATNDRHVRAAERSVF